MPNEIKYELAINITCHKEGRYLFRTLKSITANILTLKDSEINIQINFCLDNADEITKKTAKKYQNEKAEIFIYETNFGDPPLSRNFLLEKTNAKYIAFIDGDDLWSDNWLKKCFENAYKDKQPIIYVYDYIYSFENRYEILKLIDSTSEDFNIVNLIQFNYYPATLFVHHEIFDNIKFEAIVDKDIYGPEDWIWNIKALQKGYRFKVIEETALFYRRKFFQGQSVNFQHYNSEKILPGFEIFSINKLRKIDYMNIRKENDLNIEKTIITPELIRKDTDINILLSAFKLVAKNAAIRWLNRIKKMTSLRPTQEDHALDNIEKISNEEGKYGLEVESLFAINKIEPQITDEKYLNSPKLKINYFNDTSFRFFSIAKKLKNVEFDTLIFIPWLIRGGADRTVINLVKGLIRLDQNTKILVVITEKVENTWLDKIGNIKNVDILELKNGSINSAEDNLLIRSIIVNWGIKNIHIVNSEFGYNFCLRYNKMIVDRCKLFVHIYAFGKSQSNFSVGYASDKIFLIYDYLYKIVSDNKPFLKELVEVYDFEESKLYELPQPVDNKPIAPKVRKPTNKIFFAGRLSPEKLIDLVIKIGAKLTDLGIQLDLWGTPSGEYNYILDDNFEFETTNIKYRGKFDSFFEISLDEYDLILFTSLNEGMPNIVLEAIFGSKFVVASAVGGVNDIITHKKNGFLVKDIQNIESYIEGIKFYYDNFDIDKSIEENDKVINKHSEKNYLDVLGEILN